MKCKFLDPPLVLLNQKLWGFGLAISGLPSFPDDSDAS